MLQLIPPSHLIYTLKKTNPGKCEKVLFLYREAHKEYLNQQSAADRSK